MVLERKFNNEGQEQIIDNSDRIIKIDDMFLQVRLIRTKKWKDKDKINGEFTKRMPRARFINPIEFVKSAENPYYLVRKDDLKKLKTEELLSELEF